MAPWLWECVRRSSFRRCPPYPTPVVADSILLWIVTAGLCQKGLRQSCAAFGDAFHNGRSALSWRAGGRPTLRASRGGDRIVLVTTARPILAEALIAPLGHPIECSAHR